MRRDFIVDWEGAATDARSWDDFINGLDVQVSIPKRLVLPCGMKAWDGTGRSAGLLSMLGGDTDQRNPDRTTLRQKLWQRPFDKYCISSDGDVPAEIDSKAVERLYALTRRALGVTGQRLRREAGTGRGDNEAPKYLTSQFRRCPRDVATWLNTV